MALRLVLLAAAATALDDGLALTPPVGYRTWNAYAGDIDDALIRTVADALVKKRPSPWTNSEVSLADLGFSRLGIDDGWQACGTGWQDSFHAEDGTPLVNGTRFPDLKQLVAYGNAAGLVVDWYEARRPVSRTDRGDAAASRTWLVRERRDHLPAAG